MGWVELAIAAVLALFGARSLRSWMARDVAPVSVGERLVWALHVTARVGLWFAFAGLFVGYALIENPYRFRWYVLVVLGLAALQLFTGLALWRSPDGPSAGNDQGD
jgi:hypothetical protein